jgi:hypothetical protein
MQYFAVLAQEISGSTKRETNTPNKKFWKYQRNCIFIDIEWVELSVKQCGTVFLEVNDVSGVPNNFFRAGGGVLQIQLRKEGRENGDLGAVAP